MDYTQIISAVIALISALVSAFLIPWIKTKIDADKLQTLRTYVEIGVKAAEQLYTATDGAAKKAYVVNFLAEKGILWGWKGDKNAYHGGARYAGNAVPDVSADGMIAKCKDVSASGWDKLVPGEGLWLPGHWGMYIGDGLAVECTPAWKNGVQITAVLNIGSKSGYNARRWEKHGKLPWVEYDTETVDKAVEDAKKTIKAKAGLADNTIKYLADYKYGDDLLKKLAAAMR